MLDQTIASEIQSQSRRGTTKGLVGFFGHAYGQDPDDPERTMIRHQFRVVRKLDAARYVIQFYSFVDGEPNKLGVMSEAKLLGDTVSLYPDAQSWRLAYEKEWRRREVFTREEEDAMMTSE
jgi:hypothetical protein